MKKTHEIFFGKITEWIDDPKLHYENEIVAFGYKMGGLLIIFN